ncbi:MAG: chemotaxis protein CheW [Kovacikia sp.]
MNTSILTTQPQLPQKVSGDAYLKLQIDGAGQVVLSMKQVQEVLAVPTSRLTPMPNVSACLLGLMNRRSHVLWVADLAQILGAGYLNSSTHQCNVAIVRVGEISLGLAVQRVDGMCWLAPEEIQSLPPHVSTETIGYLLGCVLQNQQVLLVLNAESIVNSPALHACQR